MLVDFLRGGIAFAFPGIGIRLYGTEGDFYKKFKKTIAPFLEEASELAGLDLGRALLAGDLENQSQRNTEIFTHAFNCGAAETYLSLGLKPICVAGHSLGVYAALTAAGAVSFSDTLKMVDLAHRIGRELCPAGEFGAVVTVGPARAELDALIREQRYTSLFAVIENNSTSHVFSGEKEEINDFAALVEERGALKTILLRIDIPFHNPLFMLPASRRLLEALREMTWQRAICPLVSALDQRLLEDPQALIAMTAENLACPLNWPGVLSAFLRLAVQSVVECGPGISLTQHARLIPGAPRHYNLKNLQRRLGF